MPNFKRAEHNKSFRKVPAFTSYLDAFSKARTRLTDRADQLLDKLPPTLRNASFSPRQKLMFTLVLSNYLIYKVLSTTPSARHND